MKTAQPHCPRIMNFMSLLVRSLKCGTFYLVAVQNSAMHQVKSEKQFTINVHVPKVTSHNHKKRPVK